MACGPVPSCAAVSSRQVRGHLLPRESQAVRLGPAGPPHEHSSCDRGPGTSTALATRNDRAPCSQRGSGACPAELPLMGEDHAPAVLRGPLSCLRPHSRWHGLSSWSPAGTSASPGGWRSAGWGVALLRAHRRGGLQSGNQRTRGARQSRGLHREGAKAAVPGARSGSREEGAAAAPLGVTPWRLRAGTSEAQVLGPVRAAGAPGSDPPRPLDGRQGPPGARGVAGECVGGPRDPLPGRKAGARGAAAASGAHRVPGAPVPAPAFAGSRGWRMARSGPRFVD